MMKPLEPCRKAKQSENMKIWAASSQGKQLKAKLSQSTRMLTVSASKRLALVR